MIDFSKLDAYELLKKEDIKDIQSTGYLLRHIKSGARVMLLENDDENKVFNIAFRTTPSDSTGVAHIMEHSVLCGSRKFPAKDPFVELAKGSMNTFLNAMTYPDKTMYPVASCNDKDFANLMEVYLDAVFYPNIYIHEEIFRQEGWHYELEDENAPVEYNGVVYNEMKGAFSTPDDVVEREIMNVMFPDTVYHHESGGDPACIPDLTYEDYLDFHRTYYHPCNSYIYLYGAVDFTERLQWMDREYLSRFEKIYVPSQVGLQKPFEAMKRIRKEYPVGQEEDEAGKTYLTFNAVVGTSLDTRLATAFAVLSYVLLEAPGAPLKQKLLDEGIGKDILSSYDSGIRQPVFSIIAKEADASDEEAFLSTLRQMLTQLADEGLDEKAIRAAINIMEFKFREADYGTYPKGLMYGIDVFDSWLYDEDHPFDYLRQLEDYAFLKEQIGTSYFEELIRTYLLDNPHCALMTVVPKKGLAARSEQEVREKLDAFKAALSPEQIRELAAQTKALREYQETPSTQEELESIPMLTREDLGRWVQPFSNRIVPVGDSRIVHHAYNTNGIAYISLLLDASCVPEEDLVYLGILKNTLGFVDTKNYGYSDLYNEINLNTGGISVGISIFPDACDKDTVRLALGVQARTLYEKIGYCFDMIREILLTSDLTQEKRLLEILRKTKSRLGTRLTEAGSATAATRGLSYFSPMYRMNDCFGGIEFYDTLKDLEEHFDEKKDFLIRKLKELLGKILAGKACLVSYTGGEEMTGAAREGLESFLTAAEEAGVYENCPDADTDRASSAKAEADPAAAVCGGGQTEEEQVCAVLKVYPPMELKKKNEGLKTSGKVQYVARCGNFRAEGCAYNGALKVLKTIMSFDYLWSNLRVIGGAYGCSASFFRTGDTMFVSYRDPQLKRTLEVYEGVTSYLEGFTVDERDMTKYVIGTISDLDTPLGANAKGTRSMNALLGHLTTEQLQKEREEVLGATQESIRALAPLAKAALGQGYVCVLGNEDRISAEQDLFLTVRDVL